MKHIAADAVHALLDYPGVVEGLKAFHRQDIDDIRDVYMTQPNQAAGTDGFLLLPAWQRGQAIGVKLVSVFPENERTDTGLPTVQGVYALFDGATGEPTAIIDGTALTLRKTAGDSATGASFLARDDARVMVMAGAGAMAPHLIMAHTAIRPSIREVWVWNRTGARAEKLAETLKLDGITLRATSDLEAATREADVISCATMAQEPLIEGAWLKPGAHLDLVGGYQPEMREADDECVRRARVYVDSRWFTVGKVGDIKTPVDNGVMTEDGIVGDLFELSRGTVSGRQTADEITLFKNGGGGHLDLGVARLLVERFGQNA